MIAISFYPPSDGQTVTLILDTDDPQEAQDMAKLHAYFGGICLVRRIPVPTEDELFRARRDTPGLRAKLRAIQDGRDTPRLS